MSKYTFGKILTISLFLLIANFVFSANFVSASVTNAIVATSTIILDEEVLDEVVPISSSIYLDKETIAKGYTVTGFDDALKLSLVPGILDEDTRVDLEEITDEMPIPWNLNQISKIYQFEFRNKNAYDNHKPFYIQFSYDELSDNYKRVFFFDKNYNTWRELPTRDYPEEKFVRSLIHLPYARIVVLSDSSRLTVGKASWYAYKGGDFAASPDFPKGSKLRVYNKENDKYVDVVVNDYGPDRGIFPDRAIDLDKEAFAKIASIGAGIIDVKIEPLVIVPDGNGKVLGVSEKGLSAVPETKSKAVLVLNEKTGEVILEKNTQDILPLASLTKLVAIKVFLETKPDLDKEVVYLKQDELYNYEHVNPWESAKLKVEEGETMTIRDLLYAAVVGSANNAVESLVRVSGLARNEFIKTMNQRVKDWGAVSTSFVEPTGLAPANVTTATDYAIITREVFKDNTLAKISVEPKYTFETINTKKSHTLRNTNTFIRDDFFAKTNNLKITGSKTGYLDEALYCLMTRASGENDAKVLVVSLGVETRDDSFAEVQELLKYGVTKINDSL